MGWDEDFEEVEEGEKWARDVKIDGAKEEVVALVEGNPKAIYYIKQIQVLFEKDFFHWITGRAVSELIEEGRVGVEERALENGRVKFIFNPSHRRRKRQIKRAVKVIEGYSVPEIARASGEQAENLMLLGLMERKFELFGRNTRKYGEREWAESEHTLDFIVGRDGVAYGAEVKNTWDYIPRDELRLKLRMCEFQGVRPLIIMRHAAKSYIYEIGQRGGYGMIFVAHIFAMGQEKLVRDIRKELGMPCDAPRKIPDGIMERFERWHCGVAGVNFRGSGAGV